jgi:hypothetical protein
MDRVAVLVQHSQQPRHSLLLVLYVFVAVKQNMRDADDIEI